MSAEKSYRAMGMVPVPVNYFLLEALEAAGAATRDLSDDQRVEVRALVAYMRGFLAGEESKQ
jgi:hypothetical protein